MAPNASEKNQTKAEENYTPITGKNVTAITGAQNHTTLNQALSTQLDIPELPLPDGLSFDGVTITIVEPLITDLDSYYSAVALKVDLSQVATWSLADDLPYTSLNNLTASLNSFTLRLIKDQDHLDVSLRFDGSLVLAGQELDIFFDWPAGIIDVRYSSKADNVPPDPNKFPDGERAFLSGLGLPNGDHNNGHNLRVDALALRVIWQQNYKQFSVNLAASHLLDLSRFKVEQFQVEFSYARVTLPPTDQTTTLGRVWTELVIPNPQQPDGSEDLRLVVMGERVANKSAIWRFAGSIATALPLGDLANAIAGLFEGQDAAVSNQLPEFIRDTELERLAISFETPGSHFTFGLTLQFPNLHDATLAIDLDFQSHEEGDYDRRVSGTLLVDGLQFEVDFDDTPTEQLLALTMHDTGDTLTLQSLVAALLPPEDAQVVPPIDIGIQDAMFAYINTESQTSRTTGESTGTNGAESSTVGNQNRADSSGKLVGVTLKAEINLAELPIVGQLVSDSSGGISHLQILYASKALNGEEVGDINNILQEAGVTALPAPPPTDQPGQTEIAPVDAGARENADGRETAPVGEGGLSPGFHVKADLNLGSLSFLPVSAGGNEVPPQPDGQDADQERWPEPDPGKLPSSVSPPAAEANWFDVQKKLGPLYLGRVGVRYDKGQLWFLLDASLSAAGLTLSLMGLGVSFPLAQIKKLPEPTFHLQGLGIDFQEGPLEIGGAFERLHLDGYDQYLGLVTLKTSVLSLSAMGAYAKVKGHNSLFIYGVLDFPLGGPPFFFVTGLAAGFGYNRAFYPPPIDQVSSFPLVSEVMGPKPPQTGTGSDSLQQMGNKLGNELSLMAQYLPPAIDHHFMAVGIRFTTFEMVTSFALVVITFGPFSVRLLGETSMYIPTPPPEGPPPENPLAVVKMVFSAGVVPDEGVLYLRAQLTHDSYVLSKDCHLTGGFAFYAWFGENRHAGDFVITLGGYHPHYKVLAHYPRVPRLGLTWEINEGGNRLVMKAEAYFALTSRALMVGGYVQATWDSEGIHAWYKAGADFLISWQPYHYELEISIELGASVHLGIIKLDFSVGADLHLWGPKFSGSARIHYGPVSFSVKFGAGAQGPPPLSWPAFQDAFLPKDNSAICSVAVQAGLVKTVADQTLMEDFSSLQPQKGTSHWIINGRHFCLAINTVIPIKSTGNKGILVNSKSGKIEELDVPDGLGVGAMGVTEAEWTQSDLTIKVEFGENGNKSNVTDQFVLKPVTKKIPAGMWAAAKEAGKALLPAKDGADLNEAGFIDDVTGGFIMTPGKSHEPSPSQPVPINNLATASSDVYHAYEWGPPLPDLLDEKGEPLVVADLDQKLANNNQVDLLQALMPELRTDGLQPLITPPSLADILLSSPRAEVKKEK